jgi:hypothetical protein
VSSKRTKISPEPRRGTGSDDDVIARRMRQMRKPAVGGAIAGIETIGTAIIFGMAPTCVAAAAAYLAYRIAEDRSANRTPRRSVRQCGGPIEGATLEPARVKPQAETERTDANGMDATARAEGDGARERLR